MAPQAHDEGRLPNCITIGAMKCATSSLHQYLGAHPDIAVSSPKELDFFRTERFRELGVDWYRRQFLHPAGARVALESSVNYTKRHLDTGIAERMAALIPDAKLLYVVRDPLSRIESHYIHQVGAGVIRTGFDEALKNPDDNDLIQTSRYWWQLSPFLQYYPAEQIRVISYERLAREPETVVDEVLEYLGLEPGLRSPIIGEKLHRSADKIRPRRIFLPFWEDRETRRRLRRYGRRVVGTPIERPTWDPRTRAQVAELLAEDVAAIREFSGQSFPEWSI